MFNSFNLFGQPYLDAPDEIGGSSDDYADFIAEDTPETAETTEETTETAEDTKPAETVTESPKYKLKYNHEEREVSLDELTTLGQKGMNYDKLQEKLTELQSNPALSKYGRVEEISKLLGYQTDDELIEALYQTHYENEAKTQGLTPAQVQKEHELAQKEKTLTAKEQEAANKQKETEMYSKFATNFPDIKAEMIKPETWAKVQNGMDLSTAYIEQRNQALESELATLKQNAENSKKAPIGGVSTHGSDVTESKDPFEIGFDSVK